MSAARRQPAPALRVIAFDGRTVTLDGFGGRPVVVNFFESWCPICREEQPDLSQVAREFSARVGFVGVSNHDTVAADRAYQRRFDVPYPLGNDASGRTWAHWRVLYQPVTVLVDTRGRIAERFDGGTTAGTLRAALAYLVGELPAGLVASTVTAVGGERTGLPARRRRRGWRRRSPPNRTTRDRRMARFAFSRVVVRDLRTAVWPRPGSAGLDGPGVAWGES